MYSIQTGYVQLKTPLPQSTFTCISNENLSFYFFLNIYTRQTKHKKNTLPFPQTINRFMSTYKQQKIKLSLSKT